MSLMTVRLNKLSSDWQIARAVLEDEYKVYLDKALDRIRTRYEFASHLLDVHRMWCAECPLSGCPAQTVRSDRDTCAAEYATATSSTVSSDQQQPGFQFAAPDMSIQASLRDNNGDDKIDDNKISGTALPLEVACNDEDGEIQTDAHTLTPNDKGIKQEHCDDDSSQEKAKDEKQREEGAEERLLDQLPHTHRPDVPPLLDWTNNVSDIHILIKQEECSQEYYDIVMEGSKNQSTSHQGHEEDGKTILGNSEPPRSSYEHDPEAFIPAQSGAGIDEPSKSTHDMSGHSPEEASQDQGNTDGKTILEIENKSEPSRFTYNTKEHEPEASVQAQCDAVIGEPSSSARGINEQSPVQDQCNTGDSSSNKVQHQSKGKTLQSCDKKSFHSSDYNADLKTQSEPKPQRKSGHTDGKTILEIKNKHGPSRFTYNTKEHGPEASVQVLCDASIGVPSSSAHDIYGQSPEDTSEDQFNTGNSSSNKVQHQSKRENLQSCSKNYFHPSGLSADLKTLPDPKPQSQRAETCLKLNQYLICNEDFIRRPYQCTVCNKAFLCSSHLSRHIRTHTGDKPYHCSVCNKAFSFSSNLSKHIRTHTGDKPFQCCVCNRAFARSYHLSRHLKIHTGEKPYQCSICEWSFRRKSHLSRHMRLVHAGDQP